MFDLILFGLCGVGTRIYSIKKSGYKKLNEKISREKIYEYPQDFKKIKKNNKKNIIVKIDKNKLEKLNNSNLIGYVKIIKKNNDIKYFGKKNTDIFHQMLFPNIDDNLILDPKLSLSTGVKILMNNRLFTKLTNDNFMIKCKQIIEKKAINLKFDMNSDQDHDIDLNLFISALDTKEKKMITGDNIYSITSIYNQKTKKFEKKIYGSKENFYELEENFLNPNDDLYLMGTMPNSTRDKCFNLEHISHYYENFHINTISTSKRSIIHEKYKDEINYLENLNIAIIVISIATILAFPNKM